MKIRLIASASLIVVAVSGCSGGAIGAPTSTPTPSPTVFTMSGAVHVHPTLADAEEAIKGDACSQITYPDIDSGTDVTVTNAGGTVIGVGTLGKGVVTALTDVSVDEEGEYVERCTHKFTVRDLPLGSAFYGVEVSHRGVVQFPAAKAAKPILSMG